MIIARNVLLLSSVFVGFKVRFSHANAANHGESESESASTQYPYYRYGNVTFPTSCSSSIQPEFNKALSMFYSFWYTNARNLFDEIAEIEPSCCMAYWASAMTFSHPIWDFISDDRLLSTQAYMNKASSCAAASSSISDRERAYINAMMVYSNTSDLDLLLPANRLAAYSIFMRENVYNRYINSDEDAAILYSLSLLAVGYYSEIEPANSFPHLTQAGLIAEQVHLIYPDHPGALHFIIHAYDQPPSAQRAIDAANEYLNNSVAVPHALHMPSHIYCDLGMWPQSIAANIRSMNTAYLDGNDVDGDWYHGSYFLQLSMLELAMDCDAQGLVSTMQSLSTTHPNNFNLEAGTRIPAHFIVESRNWAIGAQFDLSTFYSLPSSLWQTNPWTLIVSNFIVVVSRCLLNYDDANIAAPLAVLESANSDLQADPNWKKYQIPYWRLSFNLLVESARAWYTFRSVSFDAGIAAMETVVSLQETSWAPEVGHVWDSHEQLAEMLIIRGLTVDIERAMSVYERSLEFYPNRYHSIAGAAKCADLIGDSVAASRYYGQLLTMTALPLPQISVLGMQRQQCPTYSVNRRPDLQAAVDYFTPSNDSENDSDGDPSKSLSMALFTVGIAGCTIVLVAIVVLMWQARKRQITESAYSPLVDSEADDESTM